MTDCFSLHAMRILVILTSGSVELHRKAQDAYRVAAWMQIDCTCHQAMCMAA